MKKLGSALVLLAAAVLGSSAWGASVMDKGEIVVGTESTFPPFEFLSPDGKPQGYDVDLAEAIGQKLGKKVVWRDMSFDALIPSLLTGKIDLIAAGMSASPERAKRVGFSDVYYRATSVVVIAAGSPIKSLADLQGKTMAVQLGTIQETFLRGQPGVSVRAYQKYDDCLREVVLGRADGAMMDETVAGEFLKQADFAGKIVSAFTQAAGESGQALAMPKGDETFISAVNKALAELKQEGFLQALSDKWIKK